MGWPWLFCSNGMHRWFWSHKIRAPRYRGLKSNQYHFPTFTTPISRALPQKLWSISSEVDYLTQMPPRFLSTATRGAVTYKCCTITTSFSSSPLPYLYLSSTTTFSFHSVAIPPSSTLNTKALTLFLFVVQKMNFQIHSDQIFLWKCLSYIIFFSFQTWCLSARTPNPRS